MAEILGRLGFVISYCSTLNRRAVGRGQTTNREKEIDMLSNRQIRKLGKVYTDKQISQQNRVRYSEGMWTNGNIALLEDMPDGLTSKWPIDKNDSFSEEVHGFDENATREIYPVEIRPLMSMGTAIRFTDGHELNIWVKGGYVGALIKKGRGADSWFVNDNEGIDSGTVIVARNGRTVGVVAAVALKENPFDSTWRLCNEDLMGAKWLKLARGVLAQLPKRTGRKWYPVRCQGIITKARRATRAKVKGIEVVLSGKIVRIRLDDGRHEAVTDEHH